MNPFTKLGIDEKLADALEKRGIKNPTEIQEKGIPAILRGVDLIGQAPTGTGKTLAYLLPLLQGMEAALPQAQAVILAPTYELSMQIARTAQELLDDTGFGLRVLGLIGGANIARQMEKLKKKPQLIVGSPGRILELSRKGKLKLEHIRYLVLDEFDRLLDDQNEQTIRELVTLLPKEGIQHLMFSATGPKRARDRATFLNAPEILRLTEVPSQRGKREDLYLMVPFRDKIDTVRKLARSLPVKRGLVFVSRTFDAEKHLSKLRYEGIRAESLLGRSDKTARKKALADFQKGSVQILIATDLAARGLDIPGVDYVFNLDLPESANAYLHRAGRTARAGADGTVITLADKKEDEKLEDLQSHLGFRLKPLRRVKPRRSAKR